METITIKSGLALGAKIAEYFGFIETVSTQVEKLIHQSLKSALENLKCAQIAEGEDKIDYIKRSKDKFIDAVTVEENENKVLSLCGLSMCQYLLGDDKNAEITKERIKDVELSKSEKTIEMAFDGVRYIAGCHPVAFVVRRIVSEITGQDYPSFLRIRTNELETIKNNAYKLNCSLLTKRIAEQE